MHTSEGEPQGRGVLCSAWCPRAALESGTCSRKLQPSLGRPPLLSELSREHGAPRDRFPTPGGARRRPRDSSLGVFRGPLRLARLGSSSAQTPLGPVPSPPTPAGPRCSWTSTGRSPGCSEAMSSWCHWGTTSDTTSPRSGMPSSSTTSGSLTSSTASPTSTCRWEGAPSWGVGGGSLRSAAAWPGRLPAPGQEFVPDSWAGVSLLCQNSFLGPPRLRAGQQGRTCHDCLCVGRVRTPGAQLQHSGPQLLETLELMGAGLGGLHRPSLAPSLTILTLCTRGPGWSQGPGLQGSLC